MKLPILSPAMTNLGTSLLHSSSAHEHVKWQHHASLTPQPRLQARDSLKAHICPGVRQTSCRAEMAEASQLPARKRQRRKESLVHFSTRASQISRRLHLWEDVLSSILAEGNPFRFTGSTTGNRKDQSEVEPQLMFVRILKSMLCP